MWFYLYRYHERTDHNAHTHQFLYHKEIPDRSRLASVFEETVAIYNTFRPQMSLQGNTPLQTFEGKPMDFAVYSQRFPSQKAIRIQENTKSKCTKCKRS